MHLSKMTKIEAVSSVVEASELLLSTQKQVRKFLACFEGPVGYADVMNWARDPVSSGPIPAAVLHQVRIWRRAMFPTMGEDSIPAERLYDVLELVDTEEKLMAVLDNFSPAELQELELSYKKINQDALPDMRSDVIAFAKCLPHRRGRGRRNEMPSEEIRAQICKEIGARIVQGQAIGVAQRDIARNRKLTARRVRRIW